MFYQYDIDSCARLGERLSKNRRNWCPFALRRFLDYQRLNRNLIVETVDFHSLFSWLSGQTRRCSVGVDGATFYAFENKANYSKGSHQRSHHATSCYHQLHCSESTVWGLSSVVRDGSMARNSCSATTRISQENFLLLRTAVIET